MYRKIKNDLRIEEPVQQRRWVRPERRGRECRKFATARRRSDGVLSSYTLDSQSRVSKDRFCARFADVTGRGIGIRRVMTRAVTNDDNSRRTVATRKIFDYKPRRPLRTTADIELETGGGPRRPPRRVSPTAVIRRKPFSCRPAA